MRTFLLLFFPLENNIRNVKAFYVLAKEKNYSASSNTLCINRKTGRGRRKIFKGKIYKGMKE